MVLHMQATIILFVVVLHKITYFAKINIVEEYNIKVICTFAIFYSQEEHAPFLQ